MANQNLSTICFLRFFIGGSKQLFSEGPCQKQQDGTHEHAFGFFGNGS